MSGPGLLGLREAAAGSLLGYGPASAGTELAGWQKGARGRLCCSMSVHAKGTGEAWACTHGSRPQLRVRAGLEDEAGRDQERPRETHEVRERSQVWAALERDLGDPGRRQRPSTKALGSGHVPGFTSGPQMGLSRAWEGESGHRPIRGLEFINSCAGGVAEGEFQRGLRGLRGSRPPPLPSPLSICTPPPQPPRSVCLASLGLGKRSLPCGAEGTGGWVTRQGGSAEGDGVPGCCPAGAGPPGRQAGGSCRSNGRTSGQYEGEDRREGLGVPGAPPPELGLWEQEGRAVRGAG